MSAERYGSVPAMCSQLIELRVGMSLYWARVEPEPSGYSVVWTQHGRAMRVSGADKASAVAAARQAARELDEQRVIRC